MGSLHRPTPSSTSCHCQSTTTRNTKVSDTVCETCRALVKVTRVPRSSAARSSSVVVVRLYGAVRRHRHPQPAQQHIHQGVRPDEPSFLSCIVAPRSPTARFSTVVGTTAFPVLINCPSEAHIVNPTSHFSRIRVIEIPPGTPSPQGSFRVKAETTKPGVAGGDCRSESDAS
jgi:hypothetical protein